MKKLHSLVTVLVFPLILFAQPAGYYNGTDGKNGTELKSVLNDIISGHIDFSYYDAQYIINYSDADPLNENNVILFYTQRSQNADTYGTGNNDINREHVWAKSHGGFADVRPMDGDAFNLRPTDASVNILRSNLDFDECSDTGTEVTEAPGTYYTSSQWEPSDAVKGQVARIIFYMATRYEGENNELDLEAVDALDTSPAPEHGKLSTLLQWNRDFPPSDFERRRNERIWESQQNRNPFVDHPEFADLIWNSDPVPDIVIGEMGLNPDYPLTGETAEISARITSTLTLTGVSLFWGDSHGSETHETIMSSSGDVYTGIMDLTGSPENEYLYFKVVATDGSNEGIVHGSYRIPKTIDEGQLTTIPDIQGTGNSSPLYSQNVITYGILTANFDNTFYIQSSEDLYSGMCVFGSNQRGKVGDSLIITGTVTEFHSLTELGNVSYAYNFASGTTIEPVELTVSQVGEEYEGMLVTIRNVQFINGGTTIPDNDQTYTFTDATGSMVIYSRHDSRLVGKQLPSGTVNITGILGQYDNNYQLLVRDMNDFTAGDDTEAPYITAIQVIDTAWLMVDFNERLDATSSQVTGNYSINNGLTVLGAYLYQNTHVSLNITGLQSGTHTLTVNGVEDEVGNATSNETFDFTYTSTLIPEVRESPVTLFPNPGDGRFSIQADLLTDATLNLKIYNIAGKVIFEKTYETASGSNLIKVNDTSVQPGIYFVRIVADGAVYLHKLVVE
jgi:endonuclease I